MLKKAVCVSCFNQYENRMKFVIEYLQENGYEVTYLISDFDHIRKSRYSVSYPGSKQLHVISYKSNLSVRRILSHVFFSRSMYRELCLIGPDLIYVVIPPNSCCKAAAKYRKEHDCKLIFDVFDVWPEAFPYKKHDFLLKFPFYLWRKIRNDSLPYADYIYFVSMHGYRRLEEFVRGKKTDVLFPSIGERAELSYEREDDNVLKICYLGSINNIIDIDLIALLLGKINKKIKVVLHIIGDGEKRDTLIDAVTSAGVEVVYHGIIFEWEQKSKIFRLCDYAINIYKATVKASMTLKSSDYFCAGLPILNTVSADTHKMVEKYSIGFNINRDCIEEAVEKICETSQEQLSEMHKRCREMYLKLFSRNTFRESMKRCFEEIGLS